MTNDPKHPQMIIGLKGTIWVPIQVSPQYGYLKGIVGDMPETTVNLKAQKEKPLKLEFDSTSIPDKIDVKLVEMEKGRHYQIRVKNKAQGVAFYNGEIQFKTNYTEIPILKIRVTGNIQPIVEAQPTILNFGWMTQMQVNRLKQQKRPLTRPVTIILNKETDLQVTRVKMENDLYKATCKSLKAGRRIQVIVEAKLEKLKPGKNEDTLEIFTNQEGNTVFKVPVFFQIK